MHATQQMIDLIFADRRKSIDRFGPPFECIWANGSLEQVAADVADRDTDSISAAGPDLSSFPIGGPERERGRERERASWRSKVDPTQN